MAEVASVPSGSDWRSTSADSATTTTTATTCPSFWSGQGGALAFEMFRLDKGATEVYLQVATSRKFAVRCGATTGPKCLSLPVHGWQFLPDDRLNAGRRGIEVQYSPSGRAK